MTTLQRRVGDVVVDFARHAADALQCYADVQAEIRRWTVADVERLVGPTNPHAARVFFRALFCGPETQFENGALIDRRIYFWPTRTAQIVTAGAQTYPLSPDRFTVPECRHLFFVFQQPTLPIETFDGQTRVTVGPLSALSFFSYEGLAWVWPWVWSGGRCASTELVMHSPGHLDRSDGLCAQPLLAWVSVANAFAESRLLAAERVSVGSHVRGRVSGHVPAIHVVQLRRQETPPGERRPTLSHIDFDFRFWVSGHERNQFYPSTGEHVKIWIDPFLKGPDDKPIKDRETVYAVTR